MFEEMIRAEIKDIESSIRYDTKRLEQEVEAFKEAVQRYAVCEIAGGHLDSSLRRIKELYVKLTAEHETLSRFEYLIATSTDE